MVMWCGYVRGHEYDSWQISSDSSKGEEDFSTIDLDTEEEVRCPKFKRHHLKHDQKSRKEVPSLKHADMRPQEPDKVGKSSMDDLVKKIGHLMITISQYEAERIGKQPVKSTSLIWCFMCGDYGHLLKDCLEMKAFVTKKALKMLNEGWLVQGDGSSLPHGNLDDGGIAWVLCNQMSDVAKVETEYLHSFDLFNQEIAFPEEQGKTCTKKQVEPYELKVQMAEHCSHDMLSCLRKHQLASKLQYWSLRLQFPSLLQCCWNRLLNSMMRAWMAHKSTSWLAQLKTCWCLSLRLNPRWH
jgi:hypothetical protein